MIFSKTPVSFYGAYKGHTVDITKDELGFYIIVKDPSGEYCYDGWWRDSFDGSKTIDNAIEEALKGAMLIST